jgi:hypothetical protein
MVLVTHRSRRMQGEVEIAERRAVASRGNDQIPADPETHDALVARRQQPYISAA